MTYEEIFEKVKNSLESLSVEDNKEHIAVEFNIYGEGEGAFYAEIENGKIKVEPYEYYDRDVKIIVTGKELFEILEGKKDALESIGNGILIIEGNMQTAEKLLDFLKKPEKKKAVRKTSVKKETTKKTPSKKVAKKTTKAEKEIVEMTKSKNSTVAKDIEK